MRSWISWLILGLVLVTVGWSSWAIRDNRRALRIGRVGFSQKARPNWNEPGGGEKGFRQVRLPFFRNDGYFRVWIRSSKSHIKLDAYVQDCAEKVYLDGKEIHSSGRCRHCEWTNKHSTRRCLPAQLELDLTPGRSHLLALKTKNVYKRRRAPTRDMTSFWLEHQSRAAGWRTLFVLGLALLSYLGFARWRRNREPARAMVVLFQHAMRARFLLLAFAITLTLRAYLAPGHLTGDVSQATHLYVENLVYKRDRHVTQLHKDYEAAKYRGKSYMHKPPGLYYQYIPLRLWYGFTNFYAVYLSRFPPFLGDLLLSLAMWQMVRSRGDPEGADLAVALYLLAPSTLLVNGLIGRVDSLAVALVFLALKNIDRWRMSFYLGAAVALKQFSLLVGPWMFFRKKSSAKVAVGALFTLALISPFLIDDASLFIERMTKPQLTKSMHGINWMTRLDNWGFEHQKELANKIMFGFFASLFLLAPFMRGAAYRMGAWVYVAFVLFARNSAEHYMLWGAPFLVVYYCIDKRMLPLCVYLVMQFAAMTNNDRTQMVASSLGEEFSMAYAAVLLFYVVVEGWRLLAIRAFFRDLAGYFRRLRGSTA